MPASIKRARELRNNLTGAEQRLWRHLRMRQLKGFKFRRQRPIGPYIVDFVCLERKLIIELDGAQHADQKHFDAKCDGWLASQGFEVLRFWNHDVLKNVEALKEAIFCAFKGPATVCSPEAGEGNSGLCRAKRHLS